jgi:Mn2+/Fe2+ NRAMP family transporter
VLLLLASTVGATVTPWMIFFQQSASADKGMTPDDLRQGRADTAIGAGLAALFGLGALVAGAVLASSSGVINGYSGAGFPAGVAHATGNLPGTLLALGLIEAGAVAILTISASTAYAAAECAGVAHSFNYTPRAAFTFHGANVGIALLAGLVVLIPGAPLLSIALNANVLATVLLPVTLVFALLLANDRELLGHAVNSLRTNVFAIITIVTVVLCGAAYAIFSFLEVVGVVN